MVHDNIWNGMEKLMEYIPFLQNRWELIEILFQGKTYCYFDVIDLRWCFSDALLNYEIQFSDYSQYYYTEDMDPESPLEFFWKISPE